MIPLPGFGFVFFSLQHNGLEEIIDTAAFIFISILENDF